MNSILIGLFHILVAFSLSPVSSVNVVVWNAVGTISTRVAATPLMQELVERGHNVKYISAFKSPESWNHTAIPYIMPKKLNAAFGDSWENHVNFFKVRQALLGIPRSWYQIREFGIQGCEALLEDEEFLSWALSPETKVDLVIVEISVNECAYGFVHLWKSKLIVYSTTTVMSWMPDAHGLPDESSSITDFLFGFPSSQKNQMNFGQRFLNAMNPIVYTLTRDWFYIPTIEQIYRTRLGMEHLPSFREIERNASVILLTTHFSYETARSLPPNFVPIGGSLIYKEVIPIPKEMTDFIASAKNGFIYISFGTVTAFTHFDTQVQIEFITALRKFPDLKFIWKSSTEVNATKIPDNVFMTKWAPQQT